MVCRHLLIETWHSPVQFIPENFTDQNRRMTSANQFFEPLRPLVPVVNKEEDGKIVGKRSRSRSPDAEPSSLSSLSASARVYTTSCDPQNQLFNGFGSPHRTRSHSDPSPTAIVVDAPPFYPTYSTGSKYLDLVEIFNQVAMPKLLPKSPTAPVPPVVDISGFGSKMSVQEFVPMAPRGPKSYGEA